MAAIPVSRDDSSEQIRAMDAEFIRNANAGNADALVEAFYANDAQLLPPNSPKVSGKPAIREFCWALDTRAGHGTPRMRRVAATGGVAGSSGSGRFRGVEAVEPISQF